MISERFGREEIQAVADVIVRDPVTLSGFYKNPRGGPSIQQFENDLKNYMQSGPVFTCTNGTSALQLALMTAGVTEGMNVAVPVLTFSATATAVMWVKANPVMIDVDPESWCMSPQDLERAMNQQRIDAVIVVHLLGVPAKMNEIKDLCTKRGIVLIEDNAQSLGATYRAAACGAWGDYSTLSFQETKVITTLGEGGAVAINTGDGEDYQKIIDLRNHGQQYGLANYNCHNFRMTEAQAAFGSVQLRKLNNWVEWMRECRDLLRSHLEPYGFEFQQAPADGYGIYYILGAKHPDSAYREQVVQALHAEGWGEPRPGATIGLGYTRTIQQLPLLKQFRRYTPVADYLVNHFIWFDCHRWIAPDDFQLVANDIVDTVEKVTRGNA